MHTRKMLFGNFQLLQAQNIALLARCCRETRPGPYKGRVLSALVRRSDQYTKRPQMAQAQALGVPATHACRLFGKNIFSNPTLYLICSNVSWWKFVCPRVQALTAFVLTSSAAAASIICTTLVFLAISTYALIGIGILAGELSFGFERHYHEPEQQVVAQSQPLLFQASQ